MQNEKEKTIKKVMWRLLPIAMLLFFFSLLDRTNISFAALEMNKDLALSPSQYGTAAGIFFLGYVLFEIPSNFVLARVGARIWLARIMVTWGLVTVAMAFVQGTASLYSVRFLLGVAEAGLLPGLLLYMGLWLPARERGVAYATLLATPAIAYAVGAPFTTLLMQISAFGLKGWQIMFIIQGGLTVAVGLMTLALLPSKVSEASWLNNDEKNVLTDLLDADFAAKKVAGVTSTKQGFLDPRVLLSAALCFAIVCANFGTVLWLPQIVRSIFPALNLVQISLLISLAFIIGGIIGIFVGKSSDKKGDRKWHLVACTLVGVVGFVIAGYASVAEIKFAGVCVGILGIWSTFGVFWAYNGDLLGGSGAVGGLAFVNSVGSIGGFIAPMVLAYGLEKAGGMHGALFALAAFSVAAGILATLIRPLSQSQAVPATAPVAL